MNHTINVTLDASTFQKFAVYDIFKRLRRWMPLAVWAAILGISGLICFFMQDTKENAVLLGVVLLVIAFGLPAVYVRQFFVSIQKQIKRMKLDEKKQAYTLHLTQDSIRVDLINDTKETYAWQNLYGVYQNKEDIYLYVQTTKAFILPKECIPCGTTALWDFFKKQLPAEKMHD